MAESQIKYVDIDSLRPSKHNARTHSKSQIDLIAGSIRRFKWTYPILIDEAGMILCGFGRLLAAKKLGLHKVPVLEKADLSDLEKRALILADNKIALNSAWDRPALAVELGDLAKLLPEIDLDISITGFEPAEFDSLMVDLVDSEADPADDLPSELETKKVTPVSRRGDIWELGPHRILCGDACDNASVQDLMNREPATMVFADSPYNVAIRKTVGRGKVKYREFAVASGEMSRTQFVSFLSTWMASASQYLVDGAILYVCMDWRHIAELLDAGQQVNLELKNIVVWAKTNAGQGSFYRSQHEFIVVFKSGVGPHRNNIELGRHGRNRSNVWTYAGVNTFRSGRMNDLAVHPTVKPVAMVADAMRDCSRRGDIILDPFMGSGTTILAAERIGRRGYGLEIDPHYVDTTIKRWQDYTGRDAILHGTRKTFYEIANDRALPKDGRVR